MKSFSLEHFYEPLMDHSSYFTKRMFGGLAIYYNGLMVSVLTENTGDREWKGVEYDFDLWNGILLCTSREHHDSLKVSFNSLCHHPILGKWLYLPMNNDSFEGQITEIVEAIAKKDLRIGIVPGTRKRKAKKKKASKKKVLTKARSKPKKATKKKIKKVVKKKTKTASKKRKKKTDKVLKKTRKKLAKRSSLQVGREL